MLDIMPGSDRISIYEKTLLMHLIDKNKTYLDNKRTDAYSSALKTRCWQKIEKEFNSYPCVTKRTWKKLRKAWENIKAREKLLSRRSSRATEGESISTPESKILQQLEGEIPFIASCTQEVINAKMIIASRNGMEDEYSLTRGLKEKQDESSPEMPENAFQNDIEIVSQAEENRESSEPCIQVTPSASGNPAVNTSISRTQTTDLDEKIRKSELAKTNHSELHQLRVKRLERAIELMDTLISNAVASGRHKELIFEQHLKEMQEKSRRKQELHEAALAQQTLKIELIRKELDSSK